MKYGEHTDLVNAFLAHLESDSVDWGNVRTTAQAAWDTPLAHIPKRDTRKAQYDAAWDDADIIAWAFGGEAAGYAAGRASCEILGHEELARQNKPFKFLPMFGIESIEQLKKKGNQNDRH